MEIREEVLTALQTLVEYGGGSLSENDIVLLKLPREEGKNHTLEYTKIFGCAAQGFFHAAAKGVELVPIERVAERFGQSVEYNYPEANDTFINFAKTYWTLRLLVLQPEIQRPDWMGLEILKTIEQPIGPLFFPFPGAAVVPVERRKRDQRDVLRDSGANIDIDDFISGNPILIRDRQSSKKGCLGTSLFAILIIVISIAIFAGRL